MLYQVMLYLKNGTRYTQIKALCCNQVRTEKTFQRQGRRKTVSSIWMVKHESAAKKNEAQSPAGTWWTLTTPSWVKQSDTIIPSHHTPAKPKRVYYRIRGQIIIGKEREGKRPANKDRERRKVCHTAQCSSQQQTIFKTAEKQIWMFLPRRNSCCLRKGS